MIKGVIFDLDGTLLDTLYDLGNSVNLVLKEYGLKPHPLDAYRYFVGNGIHKLIQRAFPENSDIDLALDAFMRVHREHYMDMTKPYPGIVELLEYLKKKNILIAVCTNKEQSLASNLIKHYFKEFEFVDIVGDRGDDFKKPDPYYTLNILNKMNLKHHEVLFVGDTNVDIKTALNAKLKPIGVAWGFREIKELKEAGAKAIIESPLDLISLIESKS